MSQTHIKQVLIADDDHDHVLIFKRILEREFPRITTHAVHDGNQLIQFLHLHPVDLVFLDLNMPCKNGHECLMEIKKDVNLQHIPVVVYSSSAQVTDIRRSFIHQADFYLVKPFISEHLVNALKMILSVDWKKEDAPIKNHYFINNRFVPYTP